MKFKFYPHYKLSMKIGNGIEKSITILATALALSCSKDDDSGTTYVDEKNQEIVEIPTIKPIQGKPTICINGSLDAGKRNAIDKHVGPMLEEEGISKGVNHTTQKIDTLILKEKILISS